MQRIISGLEIFTGSEFLQGHSIYIQDGLIDSLLPPGEIVPNIPVEHFEDCTLMPAFVDAQVYGARGKLFSVFPSAETLSIMEEAFLKVGTVFFQPTIATNTPEVIRAAIDAVRDYKAQGGKAVSGLHIEGPWINPLKKGAHLNEWIHAPRMEEVSELLEYGSGLISMITLAPEICSREVMELIASKGIIVSAGHSDADFDQATEAFNGGVQAVTHLFNAMSGMHHRAPGLPGATLLHDKVKAGIIPDGIHVDFKMVRLASKLMGNRLFAITDAVTETSSGPYRHELREGRYECNATLSGSALSMYQAFFNLVTAVGIDKGEAHRMCSLYPAQLLGSDQKFGKIAPHCAGQLLVVNKQLKMVDVII